MSFIYLFKLFKSVYFSKQKSLFDKDCDYLLKVECVISAPITATKKITVTL